MHSIYMLMFENILDFLAMTYEKNTNFLCNCSRNSSHCSVNSFE